MTSLSHASSPSWTRFFTKLDLTIAYWQFLVREDSEEDQYKTSFRVPCSQCEFCVSTFGVCSISSVMMLFMHLIFGS